MAHVKISNRAVCGLWYILNGTMKGNDIKYLWKTDLQWHDTVVGDEHEYPHNAFHLWPGYWETEEEANNLHKQYVNSVSEN